MFYNYIVKLYPKTRKPEEYFFNELDRAESFYFRCQKYNHKAELYCVDFTGKSKKVSK